MKPKKEDAGHSAVSVEESTKDDIEEAVSFFGIITQSLNSADHTSPENYSGNEVSEDEDTTDPAGLEVRTKGVKGHVD